MLRHQVTYRSSTGSLELFFALTLPPKNFYNTPISTVTMASASTLASLRAPLQHDLTGVVAVVTGAGTVRNILVSLCKLTLTLGSGLSFVLSLDVECGVGSECYARRQWCHGLHCWTRSNPIGTNHGHLLHRANWV